MNPECWEKNFAKIAPGVFQRKPKHMNIADKLQEISDRISGLSNIITVVQEELQKAIKEIREQVKAQPKTQPKKPQ